MITDAISGFSEAVKDSRWDIYIYYCVKYRINHTASVQLKKKSILTKESICTAQ